jgi:integrase
MKWEHIGIDNQRVLLPLTKNGSSRWVPLTKKAMDILDQAPRTVEHVFPITDVALRQSWERLRNRANLIDFTFHDLRHEAISRMFEKGLNVPEVASISGHKTASQLFRYVQVNIIK